jgi:hypothetical protein
VPLADIANNQSFQDTLIANNYFTENLAKNENFITNLGANEQFVTNVVNNPKFISELTTIVKANETVTTLTKDPLNNGKYVYKNEADIETTIDVVGDVIQNASTIFNNPDVTTIIENISTKTEGNVTFNAATNEFSYIDSAGVSQLVDISGIVKANETLTSLSVSGTVLTYTDEKSASSVIDLSTISSTKVSPGTNVTVTGSGTSSSPFVVSSAIETAVQTPSNAIVGSSTQVAVPSTNVQGAISDLAAAVKTAGNNIYTADGTLTSNRVVSQGARKLKFTSSIVDAFSIDGTSFSVDAENDRVGIGTVVPAERLDVDGNVKFSGALMPDGISGDQGQILQSDGVNTNPIWVLPSSIVKANETLTSLSLTESKLTYNDEQGTVNEVDLSSLIANEIAGKETVTTLELVGNKLIYKNETVSNPVVDLAPLTQAAWNINGNSGTVATTNFVGTRDDVDLAFRTNNVEKMRILSNGNVGIANDNPDYVLDVIGDARISNNVYCASIFTTSDIRLKKDIKNISSGLKTISLLRPVSYLKKNAMDSKNYNIKETGFIAQEVRKVLPDLVTEMNDVDKTLIVNYNAIIPILTKAVQEQQVQIEAQQKQIDLLIKALENKK